MTPMTRRAALAIAGVAVLAGGFYGWRWVTRTAPNHANLAYGEGARNLLDVYLPAGPGPHPVVIDIHGGAFKLGDKAGEAVAAQILTAGIAIVRINYRLSGTDLWPAQGQDCLAAVAFLRARGADFGLDPARLALWGQSAGGFLAVSTALSLTEAGQPPQAVVDFYGPMDFSTMDADMASLGRTAAMGATDPAASPESELLGYVVGENRDKARAVGPIGRLEAMPATALPPLMIRHGDADTFIAHVQSERLRDAWLARDAAATVDFALVPGAGHGGGDFNTDVVLTPTAAFLAQHLGMA